jgi:hypothetical protein
LHASCQAPGRWISTPRSGRFRGTVRVQMKAPWTDPSLRELLALAALAAFGCGLALARGDLLFLCIFGVASAVTIIEAIRRSR